MATSPPTPLFPSLPPELRNEIYAYLSQPTSTSTPTNSHIPLGLKTFTCKHTTTTLLPIHHSTPGLLSLDPTLIPEAGEYVSYLISNSLTLLFSIHFRGRINTFVPYDWDKKIQAHLRKLAKSFPWLRKVSRYEVQILWEPVDGALKSKGGKRCAGDVCAGLVRGVTGLMDGEVGRKKGWLKVGVNLDHGFAVGNAFSSTKFGLNKFLGEELGFRTVVREVRKTGIPHHRGPEPLHPAFRAVENAGVPEEKRLILLGQGSVGWSDLTKGPLIMRRTTGVGLKGSTTELGKDAMGFPMCHLMAECVKM